MRTAVSLRVADYYTRGPRSFFRLHEKGGWYNAVPAHHTAQAYVHAYLEVAARIAGHESTRTTQLYNRLHEEISLGEIERIHN